MKALMLILILLTGCTTSRLEILEARLDLYKDQLELYEMMRKADAKFDTTIGEWVIAASDRIKQLAEEIEEIQEHPNHQPM